MPISANLALGPTPDTCSKCGEPIEPAQRTTSRFAQKFFKRPLILHSIPVAVLPSKVTRVTNALLRIVRLGRFFASFK